MCALCLCPSGTELLQGWGGGAAALIVSKLHQECGICACLTMLGGLHSRGLCPCAASSRADSHSCRLATASDFQGTVPRTLGVLLNYIP